VDESHFPRMSHWRMTRPPAVNSTTVLSGLPSVLACPCGPMPFWKAVNRSRPMWVMSSGWVSGSVRRLADPAGRKVWCSLLPNRTGRTRKAGAAWFWDCARAAVAAAAGAAGELARSRPAGMTAAAAMIFAARRVAESVGVASGESGGG
jgi:hypothetical protein